MQGLHQEKIWDPVTRLWHWVLVLSVGLTWAFGEFMTFDTVQWHFYIGYLILGLMAFRIVYGFAGPAPIRFKNFLPTPAGIVGYLKTIASREPSGTPGHNPLGGLSVVALVLAITAEGITGLFIEVDDFFEAGPLNRYVTEATANKLNAWHEIIGDAILILVALHVAAILFYLVWKRENLIKPMITGLKWVRRK